MHFGQTSKSDRCAGLLSFHAFRIQKVIVHILKLMRNNLTGNHCNRFRIGTEQLKRGGLDYHSCKTVLNALLSSNIFFWPILEK